MLTIPTYKNKKDLFNFLIENKDTLIAQKKASIKHADGFQYFNVINNKSYKAAKVDNSNDLQEIRVKAVINTTNWMDSHNDVHIPGLWNKSLKENNFIMHIQEHEMQKFDKIISDGADLKAFTANYTFSELGINKLGNTQALIFDSLVKRSRNEYMFNQYAKGYVNNHSVGMQYVKLGLAINDSEEVAEFELWEKYINTIANKEIAENKGFFWVVKEAKIIEGSAVPLGSNTVTPTIEIEPQKSEPLKDTQSKSTQSDIEFLRCLNDKLKSNINN
jgi:hypothetical protein